MLRLFSEPTRYLSATAPWSFEAHRQRQRPSDLVWSGVDDLVRGTWRLPSFVEKVLSGNRDQGDRGFSTEEI